jgi:hypothetical protein
LVVYEANPLIIGIRNEQVPRPVHIDALGLVELNITAAGRPTITAGRNARDAELSVAGEGADGPARIDDADAITVHDVHISRVLVHANRNRVGQGGRSGRPPVAAEAANSASGKQRQGPVAHFIDGEVARRGNVDIAAGILRGAGRIRNRCLGSDRVDWRAARHSVDGVVLLRAHGR